MTAGTALWEENKYGRGGLCSEASTQKGTTNYLIPRVRVFQLLTKVPTAST